MERRNSTLFFAFLVAFFLAVTANPVSSQESKEWKFGVMSDTQWPTSPDNKNPSGTSINVINHLNREFIRHHVKFVVQVGEVTDGGASDAMELDARATFAQALYNAGIGFYPLRGNHESSKPADTPNA